MALQTELSPPGVLAHGLKTVESRNLRLLQPWAPDPAAPDGAGRIGADRPARQTRGRRTLASVSAVEVWPARPSARLVMRQLLDAWRSAERQLAAAVEGSLERTRVQTQVATLRALYQGLFVQVRYAHSTQADRGLRLVRSRATLTRSPRIR